MLFNAEVVGVLVKALPLQAFAVKASVIVGFGFTVIV
jgi:hypothetical protein